MTAVLLFVLLSCIFIDRIGIDHFFNIPQSSFNIICFLDSIYCSKKGINKNLLYIKITLLLSSHKWNIGNSIMNSYVSRNGKNIIICPILLLCICEKGAISKQLSTFSVASCPLLSLWCKYIMFLAYLWRRSHVSMFYFLRCLYV
jgi:hypothetical protein